MINLKESIILDDLLGAIIVMRLVTLPLWLLYSNIKRKFIRIDSEYKF